MSSTVEAGDLESLGILRPDRGVPVPCRSDSGEGVSGEWLGFADSRPRRTVLSARADDSIHVGIELADKAFCYDVRRKAWCGLSIKKAVFGDYLGGGSTGFCLISCLKDELQQLLC